MKNLLFFISFAIMLFSCGKKTQDTPANTDSTNVNKVVTQSSDSDDDDDDDDDDEDDGGDADNIAAIKEVIKKIYKMDTDVTIHDNPIEKYGSADLKKCWYACSNANGGVNPDELYFGYDLFTGSRTDQNISWNIQNIYMQPDGSAKVSILVKAANGASSVVTLFMKNENGWVVDDILADDDDTVKGILKANT